MKGLVLSLFPGIGLLDMAFEEAGFCVVRGPDLLWGGDIRSFHPPAGQFDGVIGGPPCQFASQMNTVNNGKLVKRKANLIPEFERIVGAARPAWFLMENVPQAPLPHVEGFLVTAELLRDCWVGGETLRKRRFSFGSCDNRRFHVPTLALHRADAEPAALASGGNRPGVSRQDRLAAMRQSGRTLGHAGFKTAAVVKDHCRLQGLPDGFLDDAPFTVEGKIRAIGNGVPLALGRAVANAVATAITNMTLAA